MTVCQQRYDHHRARMPQIFACANVSVGGSHFVDIKTQEATLEREPAFQRVLGQPIFTSRRHIRSR